MQTISDLLLVRPSEAAQRCRMTLKEVEGLLGLVCAELYQPPLPLAEVADAGEEMFTTGDDCFDKVLGGGIRTGMLWEMCGEK